MYKRQVKVIRLIGIQAALGPTCPLFDTSLSTLDFDEEVAEYHPIVNHITSTHVVTPQQCRVLSYVGLCRSAFQTNRNAYYMGSVGRKDDVRHGPWTGHNHAACEFSWTEIQTGVRFCNCLSCTKGIDTTGDDMQSIGQIHEQSMHARFAEIHDDTLIHLTPTGSVEMTVKDGGSASPFDMKAATVRL